MALSDYKQNEFLKLLGNQPGSNTFEWEFRETQYVSKLGPKKLQQDRLEKIVTMFTECATFKPEILEDRTKFTVVQTRVEKIVASDDENKYRILIAKHLIKGLDKLKLIKLLDWKKEQAQNEQKKKPGVQSTDESLMPQWVEVEKQCTLWLNQLLGVMYDDPVLSDIANLFNPK